MLNITDYLKETILDPDFYIIKSLSEINNSKNILF